MIANFSYLGFCRLTNLSLITVSGADAIPFLHQQLTNAVSDLDSNTVRLAGICSIQGRLLASMHYWRDKDNVCLLVSSDLSSALVKQLSKFILRAKVKIACLDDAYTLLGLIGKKEALESALPNLSDNFPAACQHILYESNRLLRLIDVDQLSRLIWLVPRTSLDSIETQQLQKLTALEAEIWNALEVRSGIPRITLATQDQFVPQMVNFEIVHGVDFKKGCYPGQEVIARMQYRGKTKRRLQIAYVPNETVPGALLFHTDNTDQPCGTVVNTAQSLQGGMDILVEIKLQVLNTGAVYLENDRNSVLQFLPLPYAIPQQE